MTHNNSRTPYHALSDGSELHIPDWAEHRSVYRSAGRTLYLVETEHLDAATTDLEKLDHAGWNVQVERDSSDIARIALTRRTLAKAA